MSGDLTDAVRQRLAEVAYPGFRRDIVSLGVVRDVAIDGGTARISLDLGSAEPSARDEIARRIRAALDGIEGLDAVEIVSGARTHSPLPAAGQPPRPAPPSRRGAAGGGPARRGTVKPARILVGVGSGKGGVGKSTVAVNTAVALARRGLGVGFLDADVHGPSAPLMFGLEGERPRAADPQGRPRPLEAFGVRVISMGFFVERGDAVIWRGPIVGNFIRQLLEEVAWGEPDVLVIDLPPGTGDAQLTLAQATELDGAVVVTTPNDLSLVDSLKAVQMFRKVDVPILGVVENMSWFACPHCGERTEIFSHGGARTAAAKEGLRLLAEIPIDPVLVTGSDRGVPIVAEDPSSPLARAFTPIADAVAELVAEAPTDANTPPGPGGFLARFGRRGSSS